MLVPCEVKLDKSYIKSYFTDGWDLLKSPLRWRGRQWATAAAVSGLTILAYSQDDVIMEAFQRNRTEGLDNTAKYFFDPVGKAGVLISVAGGIYLYGAIAKKPRAVRAGLTGVKAIALTAVFTYAFKFTAQRHRPTADEPPDPRIWEGPFAGYSHHSFPSGHSSLIFAMAAVLSSEYKDKLWVALTSYSIAGLTAISRVYENKHWASDVIFGSALGFFIGKFVHKSTVKCPELINIPGVSSSGYPGFSMIYQLR